MNRAGGKSSNQGHGSDPPEAVDARRRPWTSRALGTLFALLAVTPSGCPQPDAQPPDLSQQIADRTSGDELLENVIMTLGQLDRYVNLELRPPVVVLDASNSQDQQAVQAVLGPSRGGGGGPFNLLTVPAGNSRFRTLGVRPGDHVRLYPSDPELAAQIAVLSSPKFKQLLRSGKPIDSDVLQNWIDERQDLELSGTDPIELRVLRVQDETTLLVAGGLPIPIDRPQRVEVWRYTEEKMKKVIARISGYVRTGRPAVGWQPSPDEAILAQLVKRLNQWISRSRPTDSWRHDPLAATLPEPLRDSVASEALASPRFQPSDGRVLQQAVWLRDISMWARGDTADDVKRATELFDWTIRNIQLESRESLGGLYNSPWETLLYGRGTAEDRAWVFALLCRQQELDVVMLAIDTPKEVASSADRWWLAALWSGGNLHLFDTRLGMPIPGPGGQGIATLAEAADDKQVLEQLQLDGQPPYPVKASDLQNRGVAALIVASAPELSQRMKLLEARLSGDDKLVLFRDGSGLADTLRKNEQIGDVRLWAVPYESMHKARSMDKAMRTVAARRFQVYPWRPMLWKARALHFKAAFNGEDGAKTFYRSARPANDEIAGAGANPAEKELLMLAKQNASYWLGLLTYDAGQYEVAIDFLEKRTLAATDDGPWTDGARYNLARAYEATGEWGKAKELLEADTSLQSHGNKLRARWMKPPATEEGM